MSEVLHSLLRRQLRRHGIELDAQPGPVRALLDAVNQAYHESDEDRLTVERSLELSSQELLTANAEMRALFEALPDVFLKTRRDGQILDCRGAQWNPDRLPRDPRTCRSVADLFREHAGVMLAALNRVDAQARSESLQLTFDSVGQGSTYEVRIVPMGQDEQLVALRDVTEQYAAEAALRQSEERFRSLVQNSSDMIAIMGPDGVFSYVSSSIQRILGYRREELLGASALSLVHPDDIDYASRSLGAVALEAGSHPPLQFRVRNADGSWRHLEAIANNLLDDPAVAGIVFNARDVTERHAAEDALRVSEERFRSLVHNASDLIAVIDADTRFLYQSPSMARVLGGTSHSFQERTLAELLHPDDWGQVVAFLSEAVSRRGEAASFEARLQHEDGSWRVFEFVGSDRQLNPAISGFVLNARDVTERRDLEEQLRYQAFHDPLTGLANRARFGDRLEHALERAGRQNASVALLFMDVDNFKSINDGLGHSIGDVALQHVATLLQQCIRLGDTAARLGGDEFAILLEESTVDDAVQLADEIIHAFSRPFEVDGDNVSVRASVGIAASRGQEWDSDGLLRNADIAMYAAKSAGKGRFEVYRPNMGSVFLDRLKLVRDLGRAMEQREFVVHYQPLVNLETSEILGFEALVRWNHPKLGLLPPAEFIGIAEESGLIVPLGQLVLEEACAQTKRWQEEFSHDPPWVISVNVSVKQLHTDFLPSLLRVLYQTGLDPTSLVLEVTESVMIQDPQLAIALLQAIRSHGVRVAIDDFGTGYSSLSYLSRFPFDILKIDKSFIDQTRHAHREGVLARAIIDLGRTFSVEVVAEGIEQVQELQRLRELNCQIGQGFYFAKPAAADEIGELLRQGQAVPKAA